MSSKTFLDVDDSLITSQLRLPEKDEEEKAFKQMVDSLTNPEKSTILVYPSPGVCVKVKTKSGEKTFINVCVSDDIPPPKDISQEELLKNVMDEEMSYVIPLSIGQERMEADKSGVPAPTYDVLINKQYFEKCRKIPSFMMFTLTAIIDGVSEKFKKFLDPKEHTVLKNRKVIGKLQPHRIEKREIKKPSDFATPGPLIEELDTKLTSKSKTINESGENNLEYVILKNKETQDDCFTGLFKIPSLSAKNVSVDIGEDRVIVEDHESNRFVDVFIPKAVDQKNVKAYMDNNIGILRLHMPLQKC